MHMEGGALAPSRLEHAASAAAQSRSHAQAKAQGVADKTHARFSPSAANRRILIYRDNRVEVRFRFADEFAWQTDILRRSQIREVV